MTKHVCGPECKIVYSTDGRYAACATEFEKAGTLAKTAAISHPSHYTHGKFECWDVVDDWGLDYYLGNVLKYICRAGRKGDAKVDLMKAREYLDRKISKLP